MATKKAAFSQDFEKQVMNLIKGQMRGFRTGSALSHGLVGSLGGAGLGAAEAGVEDLMGNTKGMSSRQRLEHYLNRAGIGAAVGGGVGVGVGIQRGGKLRDSIGKSLRDQVAPLMEHASGNGATRQDILEALQHQLPAVDYKSMLKGVNNDPFDQLGVMDKVTKRVQDTGVLDSLTKKLTGLKGKASTPPPIPAAAVPPAGSVNQELLTSLESKLKDVAANPKPKGMAPRPKGSVREVDNTALATATSGKAKPLSPQEAANLQVDPTMVESSLVPGATDPSTIAKIQQAAAKINQKGSKGKFGPSMNKSQAETTRREAFLNREPSSAETLRRGQNRAEEVLANTPKSMVVESPDLVAAESARMMRGPGWTPRSQHPLSGIIAE